MKQIFLTVFFGILLHSGVIAQADSVALSEIIPKGKKLEFIESVRLRDTTFWVVKTPEGRQGYLSPTTYSAIQIELRRAEVKILFSERTKDEKWLRISGFFKKNNK